MSSAVKKRIAILGSTGSIGTQALEVLDANPGLFQLELLTANNNASLLIEQALRFVPSHVVIANEAKYKEVKEALEHLPVQVHSGCNTIAEAVKSPTIDVVLTAMVGFVGLKPTINAIKTGKDVALANKETLVVAGELIMKLAKENKVKILPVDSEHSAIFQCLMGESTKSIEKIILTASGGPFRGKSRDELVNVTREQALNHPNWCMGNKITIDSATLMNKGLEVIEARWLFDIEPSKIEVIIHPQSIIHSMVQFYDSSIKAQMGLPDMKLPILYALAYPHRLKSDFERFNFVDYPSLTFEKPDKGAFKNLALAYDALHMGGNVPCVLNAANEVVVDAFLQNKVGFLDMAEAIEKVISKMPIIKAPSYNDYCESDLEARQLTRHLLNC